MMIPMEFSFYRDSNGNEIDLIARSATETFLVEIKQSSTPRREHFKNLLRLKEFFPGAVGLMAALTEDTAEFSDNLKVVPWQHLAEMVGRLSPN